MGFGTFLAKVGKGAGQLPVAHHVGSPWRKGLCGVEGGVKGPARAGEPVPVDKPEPVVQFRLAGGLWLEGGVQGGLVDVFQARVCFVHTCLPLCSSTGVGGSGC